MYCLSQSVRLNSGEEGQGWRHTTVSVSMQSINGSETMYRESERAYSFQSWAKRACEEGMDWWFWIQYPGLQLHVSKCAPFSASLSLYEKGRAYLQRSSGGMHLKTETSQLAGG